MSPTNNAPVSGSVFSNNPTLNFIEVLMNTTVAKYLSHLLFVAGLTALNSIILALLQSASVFNVSSLPLPYQGLAYVLIPGLILAGKSLQQQLLTELAQAQTEKALTKVAVARAGEADAKLALSENQKHQQQ